MTTHFDFIDRVADFVHFYSFRISMGATRTAAAQSLIKSPIPSTSTSIPSGLTEQTLNTPLKSNASQLAHSQVTPLTTHQPIKKSSTVRRRVVPKESKRKEIDNTDDLDDATSPPKPGKKINSQNQPTPLLNQKKQTNPVIDIVYSNDNNPSQSSIFKSSLNVEPDKGQQQLGKSDRMSKEKQKFFRHSAFNSDRIVKTSPTSTKSNPPITTAKVARNLKNQLETDGCTGDVPMKQKHLSDTSSSCTSSDDDESTSSGSCSSSSSDNDSDTSSSSQSSSSDYENETNEPNSWTKSAAVGGKANAPPTQPKIFPVTTGVIDVNGTWGFAAEAKKNFDIFHKNAAQPERVFGNFDGIDKESLVKIDKTKASDTVKDRPTADGKSSGQLKGLFDSLSHVFSTTDYTRSRQGAPPNYKLGVRRKKQKDSLDGPPKVVLKETRSTFRDYKEQRLQEQNKTDKKTEFNSFLNVSNNKLNNCSISVSNNTEAKEQFAKKYFTSTNNATAVSSLPTATTTTEVNAKDLTSPNSSPSKIPRRITPLSLPLERRNLRYHSSSEDDVPYLKPRLTPSNLVKNAINSQSQDARQKSSQLKQTSDQKLFGAISKKNSMDFASFRDSSTKLSSCTPPPYNNNQSMGKKIKKKTFFLLFTQKKTRNKTKSKENHSLYLPMVFFIIYYAILLTTICHTFIQRCILSCPSFLLFIIIPHPLPLFNFSSTMKKSVDD